MDIIIWDSTECPPNRKINTILWCSYDDFDIPNVVSIPRWVEENDQNLRNRYLNWIYDLGDTKVDNRGQRLVDHLRIRPGFSIWWMTLLAEKCNFAKSPQITDAIKLMAFDDWATTQSVNSVVFISANRKLAKCLQAWCEKKKITFRYSYKQVPETSQSLLRTAYFLLPTVFQALIWLIRHVLSRLELAGVGVSEWKKSSAQVTFVSYLFNLTTSAVKEGRYESRYWTRLPDVVNGMNCKTNWMHIYIPDTLLPNAAEAKRVLESFNKRSDGKQIHVTLDSFLSFKVIIRSMIDWAYIAIQAIKLRNKIKNVDSNGLELWPLFDKDWYESLVGKTSMSNSVHMNLLEHAFKLLPSQRLGIYLQENMDWEFAFLWAWKSANHKMVIGYPHSTVRYWDLRYFFDNRNYTQDSQNSVPRPDKVAISGVAMLKKYENGGYPRENLIKVEALRYNYLNNDSKELKIITNQQRRILVLGECVKSDTEKQMKLLENAIVYLKGNFELLVKPHPSCPINEAHYPGLSMKITNSPIEKLLDECGIAYTGGMTSAAVDAYCYGLPVISMLDPTQLNLHPLRGELGIQFASTPEELAMAIVNSTKMWVNRNNNFEFFYLDDKLHRWQKIITC